MNLDTLLDAAELAELEGLYGTIERRHFALAVGTAMGRDYEERKLKRRRAEVVCVVERPDGTVLLHTKHSYPADAYRLPSGGVEWGEGVRSALFREMHEETGYAIHGERLLGLVTYELTYEQRSVPFASFVFRVPGDAREPQALDESEGISGFRWVFADALQGVAESLRTLPEDGRGRRDWGRFRALAHDFVHASR